MRKPFLDNLRYGIVLSVAVYHVFYQFNSVGVITNVLIPGIPASVTRAQDSPPRSLSQMTSPRSRLLCSK